MRMIGRIVSAMIAFAIGIVVMPLTPLVLAAVVFNEFEDMEDF